MNSKSKVKIIYEKRIIELNSTFCKAIADPTSDEYALLQKLRQENPGYSVTRRKIKSNRSQEHYNGLTYAYMTWYINKYETEPQKKISLWELDAMIDISKCHSKGKRYPEIKKWFLEKYPEIITFGMPEREESKDNTAADASKKTETIAILPALVPAG